MRRIPYATFLAIVVGIQIGFAIATGTRNTKPPTLADDSPVSHHSELTFTLPPTDKKTFDLPRKDFPVQINVRTSNVTVAYGGATTALGPMVASAVASYDSASAIANISGAGERWCPGSDTCEQHTFYYLRKSASSIKILDTVSLALSIDRRTGQLTLGVHNYGKSSLTPTKEITYTVSMYY